MTAWVVWQDTDFCRELWEERLYNAVGMFLLHKISILNSGSQHFVKIALFDDFCHKCSQIVIFIANSI